MYIYVVKDTVSETTYPTFEANTDAEAVRLMNFLIQRQQIDINDVELYRLCSYDPFKLAELNKLHEVFSFENEPVLIVHKKE